MKRIVLSSGRRGRRPLHFFGDNMKRIIIMLSTTVLIITLAACGSPPELKTDFSALFSVHSGDADYTGALNKDGDHLTITMKEPYTIVGMVFDYSDTGLSIKSKGRSTNVDADYLPDSSVPAALHAQAV